MNWLLPRSATTAVVAVILLSSCSKSLPERTFKSDEEDFAVDFPGTPEIQTGSDEHWSVKAFQVGERVGDGGILFSVNFSRLTAGGRLGKGLRPIAILKGHVAGFCGTLGGMPEDVSVSETKFDNRYPALEYSCGKALGERSLVNEGWMIFQPDRIVRISVSYSEGLREAVSPRYRLFLNSLALR